MQISSKQKSVRQGLVDLAVKQSEKKSAAALKLFASHDELDLVHRQIAGAEVAINFPVAKPVGNRMLVEVMMESDHYMNVHESGHTGGVPVKFGRDAFELRIGYDPIDAQAKDAEDNRRDRPRYAALNIFTSGGGSAPGYGDCALVLHQRILDESTITLRDSLDSKKPLIGTVDAFDHCLVHLHDSLSINMWDDWCSGLLQAARGMDVPSELINKYVEAQNHAVVEFPGDVLYLRGRFESLFGTPAGALLQKWARRQGWPLLWGTLGQMVIDPTVQFRNIEEPEVPRQLAYSAYVAKTEKSFRESWNNHAQRHLQEPNKVNTLQDWSDLFKDTPPAARYTPEKSEILPVTMRNLRDFWKRKGVAT